jgi:hypothetical protein
VRLRKDMSWGHKTIFSVRILPSGPHPWLLEHHKALGSVEEEHEHLADHNCRRTESCRAHCSNGAATREPEHDRLGESPRGQPADLDQYRVAAGERDLGGLAALVAAARLIVSGALGSPTSPPRTRRRP